MSNGNGFEHDHDDDRERDDRETAFVLVDRALTAIGGLDTKDPHDALETVLTMYRRALGDLRTR